MIMECIISFITAASFGIICSSIEVFEYDYVKVGCLDLLETNNGRNYN